MKREDAGEYECYLPDGRRSVVKLNVVDPNEPSGGDGQPNDGQDGNSYKYAIRASVENPSIRFTIGTPVEQTCTGLTNGDSLRIEWFGPNNRVKYLPIFAFL